jgi:hypothetical protein
MKNTTALSALQHLRDAIGEQLKQTQANKERIGGCLMDAISTGSLITLQHLTKDYRCEVELLRCLEFTYKDLQQEIKAFTVEPVDAWYFFQLHQDILANFNNDAITAEVTRSVSGLFHHVMKHYRNDF